MIELLNTINIQVSIVLRIFVQNQMQKYYIETGQSMLLLWPQYRFDDALARCLVELFSRGYIDNDPRHQLWIKEARWTFESQRFKPDWYLKLKAQYRCLQRPLY